MIHFCPLPLQGFLSMQGPWGQLSSGGDTNHPVLMHSLPTPPALHIGLCTVMCLIGINLIPDNSLELDERVITVNYDDWVH